MQKNIRVTLGKYKDKYFFLDSSMHSMWYVHLRILLLKPNCAQNVNNNNHLQMIQPIAKFIVHKDATQTLCV